MRLKKSLDLRDFIIIQSLISFTPDIFRGEIQYTYGLFRRTNIRFISLRPLSSGRIPYLNIRGKIMKTPPSDARPFIILSGSVVLAILFIAAVLLTTPTNPPTTKISSVISIGAIYNLNGTQSALDIPSANGAELAVQEINERGGINGKPIRLILYDGETNTTRISEMTTKLIQQDHVIAIIGMSDSDMVVPAAQQAAAAGMVFITSGATSPLLSKEVPHYLFLACFGDNTQAAVGAEYARNDLNARTAYLISDDSMQYTRLLSHYFTERFAGSGGIIVGNISYTGGSGGYEASVQAIKALTQIPDIIYISCSPDDCGPLTHDIRKAGITVPIMGGDSFDTPECATTIAADDGDVYYTTHADISNSSSDPAMKAFISRYEQAFGQKPTAFSGLGYDTVNILASAINKSASSETLQDSLYAIDGYDGITGTLSYRNNSPIPVKSVTLMKINHGIVYSFGEHIPVTVPAP